MLQSMKGDTGKMSFCKLIRRLSILVFIPILAVGGTGFTAALADAPAASNAPQQQSLSLKDAVNIAWTYSPDLKAAQDSIDKLHTEQQDASQYFLGFQPGAGLNASPGTDIIWKGLTDANAGYATAKDDYTAIKSKVEVDTFQDYYAVISARAALDKAKADLSRDDQALAVVRVLSNLGIATDTMVAGAEGQDEASSEALNAAHDALDKTYVTLDGKLGILPADRPVLTDQLTFSPFKVDNLDAEVSKAMASGNAILNAPVTVDNTEVISESTLSDLRNTVTLEQLEYNFPWTIGATGATSQDTDEVSDDLDAARQTLTSVTDSLQTQVRGMYNDIMSLEAKYAALQSGLQVAQDNLRDVQVEYSLGLTTQDKVTAAAAACADLQSDITGVIFDHEVLKANFHWLTGEPVDE
jgi:outer membrane protein TolC